MNDLAKRVTFIRRTDALQDKAIAAAFTAVKPGMRDVEPAAIAEYVFLDGGGEQALLIDYYLIGDEGAVGRLHSTPETLMEAG